MDVKFYRCAHCGNVAIKPFDSGVPLVCCGEQMQELTANSEDAAVEKHVPVITKTGDKVHIEVGSTLHPMLPEHFITFICLVYEKGYQIVPLVAGEEPIADFALPEGGELLRVYEYCNIHGLWVAEYQG